MSSSKDVEIFNSKAEELVDPDVQLEHLASGFSWAEGPVWNFEAGYLTFSDVIGNTMYRYDDVDGVQVYRRPSNHANGQTVDITGELVVCEHETRQVTRETSDGIETLAARYDGKMFNSPNDVVATSDGSLTFTDPAYGLDKEEEGGGGEREMPFQGVYQILRGSSEVKLLVDSCVGPNGLAFSTEEERLYVADTELGHIRVFEVGQGWSISDLGVLVEIPSEGDEVPDGMKLDVWGNIYCTGKGGIWICSAEGEILGHIKVPETTANLAWGEADAGTLYITANTGLYQLRCRAIGHTPHRPST